MTEDERKLARALATVTMCPGIGTKRFARDMAFLEQHSPERELTPKQRKYLVESVVRFRRQIDREVVKLARGMCVEVPA